MADEVVRLKVEVQGDDSALKRLQSLDEIIDRINSRKISIEMDRNSLSGITQSAAELKNLGDAFKEISDSSAKAGNVSANLNNVANSTAKAGSAATTAKKQVDDLGSGFQNMGKHASSAGQSVTDMVGKFAGWYAIGEVVSATVSAFKEAVQELKNVDAELVNVQKVMGATGAEMDALAERAYAVGAQYGLAASDYLTSVNEWAQAGYNDLAADLGELSVVTQKVGDVEQATANQFLLSVDAAYQYQGSVESLTKVLDGANEIANQYATSVQDLAGGMGIVSSLAAQAGMEVGETAAAIGTITSITQETGNSAARALRALILNIQGSTEIAIDEATGERWTEEEINATAQAIENASVATREYKDGVDQLRNPIEVIGEISEKYREGLISEVQLQDIVSTLGGKTRSNQLQALISNFDMYEDMVDTFANSAGSADREIQYYLDSWEAKANRVKNSWVQLVESFQTSDIAKNILDVANGLLQIANTDIGQTAAKIALVTSAITALTLAYNTYAKAKAAANATEALADLKGLPAVIKAIAGIPDVFKNAAGQIKYAKMAVQSGRGLSTAVALLGRSVLATAGVIGAAVAAITIAANVVDKLIVTSEEQAEIAQNAGTAFQDAVAETEDLNSQLSDTQSKIAEIKSQGKLSLTDQHDLQNLEEQNRVLEARISLQERVREATEKTAAIEIDAALNKGSATKWEDIAGESNPYTRIPGLYTSDETFSAMWNGAGSFEKQIEVLGERIKEAQKLRDETIRKIEEGEESWLYSNDDALDAYTNAETTAQQGLEQIQSELTEYYNSLEGATGESVEKVREELVTLIEAAATAADPLGAVIDDIDSALNDLSAEELQSFNDALADLRGDGEITADEIVALADKFPFLTRLMQESGVTAQQLADYFLETGEATRTISSDIERLAEIVNPLSGVMKASSDALAAFQEKVNAQDFDDIYDGYSNAIEEFFADYEQGMRNSQDMWAAAELFFTPEQLETMGYDIDTIAARLEDLQQYFTGDPTQFYDMIAALAEAGELIGENNESLVELSEEGMRIPIENFDEIAEQLGISEEAFASLMNYVNMFSDGLVEIDLSNLEDYVKEMGLAMEISDEMVVDADELKKQLLEAGASGKTIADAMAMLESQGYVLVSLSGEVENLTNQMVDLGYATEEAGKIKITMPDLQRLMSDLQLSKDEAEKLVQNLWDTNNVTFTNAKGEVMDLNAVLSEIDNSSIHDVQSAADDAKKSVDNTTQAIEELDTATLNSVTGEVHGVGSAATGAQKKVDSLRSSISKVNSMTISPKVNIDVPTSGELQAMMPTATVNIGANVTSDKKATGTNFANGGLTLLGDEQGVGPKPELVIEDDKAFLAGQEGPEVVALKPGARVLKHSDTVKALNGYTFEDIIPARAGGGPAINVTRPNYNASADPDYKGNSSGSSSSSSSRPSSSSSRPSSSSSGSSGGSSYRPSSSGSGSSSRGDEKTYWEIQLEALEEYLDGMKMLTEIMERSQDDSYERQIANYKKMQQRIHEVANDFRARGLNDASREIVELQLMWQDYADKIEDVYKAMYDDLEEMHADDLWEMEIQDKKYERADRDVVQIAADNQERIAEYKRMQAEVHDLANYYRAQGFAADSELLQDLADAWWEYQEEIESVYESLTDALDKYIDSSEAKLAELEHAGASVGERIAVYIDRITRAQETLAALKFSNQGGINDEAIADAQDQIWSDQDAIADIRDALWDELGEAIDVIFEEKQQEIDLIDKEIDKANKRIEEYQDRLDEILNDPSVTGTDVGIIDLLERLSDQLDEEKEALDAIVEPLENQIEGYYRRDEDGNLEYIAGIRDIIEGYYKRDEENNLVYVEGLQDLLDAENERYNEEKKKRDEALALEKKQLAVQEAIKNLQQALYDLETARNERPLYTLKDGVWAWRPDEEAIQNAQEAVEDAEQAKEDAENDLKEYEADQKHQQIIDSLQDQIDALQKQEEEINKQIDLYQKESKARQDYINDQIEYWEKEKEAYEDHYNDLIEIQEDIIEAKEEERDALREDLENWQKEWEDITDSLKEPVRDIQDILNDIAKYGTPAMQDQVWNIVGLLEELGHGLENFNPEFGGDNDWGNGDYMGDFQQKVIEKMMQNSILWRVAADDAERERLEREQQELGQSINADYNADEGLWYDQNGNVLYSPDSPAMRQAIIEYMRQNSQKWASSENAAQREELKRQNQVLGDLIGAIYDDIAGKWYDESGNPLFDTGGVARGLGVMQKATPADEVVLSPALSNLVLTPEKNREFAQFAQSMGLIFGAAHGFVDASFTRESPASSTTDSHNIIINGVTIGESMLRRPLSDTLSLLSLHVNE